jgi:hypothetical protein
MTSMPRKKLLQKLPGGLTLVSALALIPPKDPRDRKTRSTGITAPEWILKELADIAKAEGYSRSEIIVFAFKAFVEQWHAQRNARPPDGQ